MRRDRGRGVVCVGSIEDNARVFIIVFGFWLFFLSWSDIAAFPPFPPPQNIHTHPDTHSYTVASGAARAHSKEALLGCNSLIVCNHPYPTFTSHPKSILDQFHARERNHFSKMENIFSLIICALPVVIKLLGGITEKIIALLLLYLNYFFPLQT